MLELNEREEQPDHLDSKLLLDWAPQCIRRLGLTGGVCGVRGMAALVSASTQLRKLTLHCSWDMLQCAQTEAILAACHSLKILTCSGTFVPSQNLSSVTALKVDLSWWSKLALRGYAPEGQLQALLFRLRSASALQRLWLCLRQLPMLPAVPETQLYHLHEVKLHFSIGSGKPANLDWLQEQSIDELSLSIKITTGALSDHSDLVQQLHGLTLHRLEFTVHAVVELAAQLLWAGLVVKGELSISIFRGVALLALPQSRWRTSTLHALPICSHVRPMISIGLLLPAAMAKSKCLRKNTIKSLAVQVRHLILGSLGSCVQALDVHSTALSIAWYFPASK